MSNDRPKSIPRDPEVALSCPTCGERLTIDAAQNAKNTIRSRTTAEPTYPGCREVPWCSLVEQESPRPGAPDPTPTAEVEPLAEASATPGWRTAAYASVGAWWALRCLHAELPDDESDAASVLDAVDAARPGWIASLLEQRAVRIAARDEERRRLTVEVEGIRMSLTDPRTPEEQAQTAALIAAREAAWAAGFEAHGREAVSAWLADVIAGHRALPVAAEPEAEVWVRITSDGEMWDPSPDLGSGLAAWARDVADRYSDPERRDTVEPVPVGRAGWLAALDAWFDLPMFLHVQGPAEAVEAIRARAA